MKSLTSLQNEYKNEEMLIENKSNELFLILNENLNLDEGIFGTIFGGIAGSMIGPIIGRTICKVLGVEKGLLFDLLTSKLVTDAIGVAIANGNIEIKK